MVQNNKSSHILEVKTLLHVSLFLYGHNDPKTQIAALTGFSRESSNKIFSDLVCSVTGTDQMLSHWQKLFILLN